MCILSCEVLLVDYSNGFYRLLAPEGYRMRRLLILPGLFLVAAVAWACGDKLMLVMGARSLQDQTSSPCPDPCLSGPRPRALR